MTNKQAYDYWKHKYLSARDYYDEHWDAEERHAHQEYVEALVLAMCALGVWCIPVKKIKFVGDTVMMPIADFNKLNRMFIDQMNDIKLKPCPFCGGADDESVNSAI